MDACGGVGGVWDPRNARLRGASVIETSPRESSAWFRARLLDIFFFQQRASVLSLPLALSAPRDRWPRSRLDGIWYFCRLYGSSRELMACAGWSGVFCGYSAPGSFCFFAGLWCEGIGFLEIRIFFGVGGLGQFFAPCFECHCFHQYYLNIHYNLIIRMFKQNYRELLQTKFVNFIHVEIHGYCYIIHELYKTVVSKDPRWIIMQRSSKKTKAFQFPSRAAMFCFNRLDHHLLFQNRRFPFFFLISRSLSLSRVVLPLHISMASSADSCWRAAALPAGDEVYTAQSGSFTFR